MKTVRKAATACPLKRSGPRNKENQGENNRWKAPGPLDTVARSVSYSPRPVLYVLTLTGVASFVHELPRAKVFSEMVDTFAENAKLY